MRSLTSCFALTLLLGLPLRAEKSTSVQWTPLSKEILKTAASDNKFVFVDVYTQWCGYCKKLDAVTFRATPVIAELEKHFISVRMDAESDESFSWKGGPTSGRDLASRWNVDGFPTLLFLNSKGVIIGSYSSYADPDLMVKLLTYISSGARERKVSFEDYLKGS